MRLLPAVVTFALAAGPLLGCAEDPGQLPTPPAAPKDAVLLSTLHLAEGAEVRFYDVETDVLTVEIGHAGRPSPLKRLRNSGKLTPADVHRALAPGRQVPDSLLGAQLRIEEFRRTHKPMSKPPSAGDQPIRQAVTVVPVTNPAEERGPEGTSDALCPASWFAYYFCDGSGPANLGPGCALNRFNGGYSSGQISDVTKTEGAVCPFQGTATYRASHRTWWSWNNIGPYTIPPGKYMAVTTWDVSFDYDYWEGVDQKSGIGYHRKLNYCLYGLGCG